MQAQGPKLHEVQSRAEDGSTDYRSGVAGRGAVLFKAEIIQLEGVVLKMVWQHKALHFGGEFVLSGGSVGLHLLNLVYIGSW